MDLQYFSFFPVFITFLLFIFVVLTTSKNNISRATPKLPPGPWRLPIIGNMHQLVGSLIHRRLGDLARKYGPVMHLQLGEISHVVISSPELAKQVMKTHDLSFIGRPSANALDIITYDRKDIIFAPYGDSWRQLRKICILELLSAKRVQTFRSIREEEVSNLVKFIDSSVGLPVNVSRMVLSLTNSITSRTAFGKLSKEHQDILIPLLMKLVKAFGGFSIVALFPSAKLLGLLSGTGSECKRLHVELDQIFETIINEHRGKFGSEGETNDIVDVLLHLQDQGNLEFDLTMENVKAVIFDMFGAGTETSATLLEWTMSEILKNSRVMQEAQAEVRRVFNGKESINETSLSELKYLKLVIKETLRLHPPAPLLLPRETRERVEINEYEIPVKTKIFVNAWAIGRDPDYWSEAERFYPERFVDSSIDYKGTNFEFIPFGAGRRMCPGILYGLSVVELTLANLLYHFDWRLPGGVKSEDLDMSEAFGITVKRKNELHLIPLRVK